MTLISLQALTWGTVTGAVVSALMLASGESGSSDLSRIRRGAAATPPPNQATPAERKDPALRPVNERRSVSRDNRSR